VEWEVWMEWVQWKDTTRRWRNSRIEENGGELVGRGGEGEYKEGKEMKEKEERMAGV